MQTIIFYKYEGAGNDFIMINNLCAELRLSKKNIYDLCDRHFGIGADGLIVLEKTKGYDFTMLYYNSDGSPAKMCGNGSRCAVAFAKDLHIIENQACFTVGDMVFHGTISSDYLTTIKMPNSYELIYKNSEEYFFTISQVPHVVKFKNNLTDLNILSDAQKTRYSERFIQTNGTNINYVEKLAAKQLFVRTYERGVEAETLACGTGIIASVLAIADNENLQGKHSFEVNAKGGKITISFNKIDGVFKDISMTGYSKPIFKGEIKI